MPKKPPPDRNQEFLARLQRYYDFGKYDSRTFPNDIPDHFRLQSGTAETVGFVVMDWKKVLIKLIGASAQVAKPADVSLADHVRHIEKLCNSVSPDVLRAAAQ